MTNPQKYGYANARVMGMKAHLLSPQMLEEMASVKTIEAMAELMQRTVYKEEFGALALKYSGSDLISLAASSHFGKVARKILLFTPKSDRQIIEALLMRWDILNLKLIISAKRVGKPIDEIKPYLIRAGTLSDREISMLLRADEKEILDALRRTDIGRKLFSQSTAEFSKELLERFKKSLLSLDNLIQINLMLSAYAYIMIVKELESLNSLEARKVSYIIKREADIRNISNIYRLRKEGKSSSEIMRYMLKGGSLSERQLFELADAKDTKGFIELVKHRFPDFVCDCKSQEPTPVEFEIALEKALYKSWTRSFYGSVLSVGTLAGFILLKELEVKNLRKIAMAKEFGIPAEEVKKMLVI